jgi:hypothetical protein
MTTMNDTSALTEEAPNLSVHGIVGGSLALRRVLRLVECVAATDAAVLVRGETGTGKELIGGLIHALSPRRDRPFIKFSCAAIPAGLVESELFGHERGAFTGAIARRIGRFEMARGSTLLLDEIGDLPLDLQPKLLRVLEAQEFERVGSAHTIRSDVRVVAATNRPLEELLQEEGVSVHAGLPDGRRRHGGEPCARGANGRRNASDRPFARARSHAPRLQSHGLAAHSSAARRYDLRRRLATSRIAGMTGVRAHAGMAVSVPMGG